MSRFQRPSAHLRALWLELAEDASPPDLQSLLAVYEDCGPSELANVLLTDQYFRWQRDITPRDVEFYLELYPAVATEPELVLALVTEETRYRRESGQQLNVAEYRQRFPQLDTQRLAEDLRTISSLVEPSVCDFRPISQSPAAVPEKLMEHGRFVIRRRLGAGGMGVVYEAFDHARNEVVALKTMQHLDANSLYRFKREFRALADVTHPHLVALYELFTAGESWFFTMELVEGADLLSSVRPRLWNKEDERSTNRSYSGDDSTWKERRHLPPDERPAPTTPAAPLPSRDFTTELEKRLRESFRQLAEAVDFIHQRGLLHRDLKPSNVLVTDNRDVKLLDFGLAVPADQDTILQSARLHFAGTVAYMSPEQAASRPLTPASDWYSFGVMLYQALTGVLPFRGTHLEILTAKQTATPPPPQEITPGLPKDLCELCQRLLTVESSDRLAGSEILQRLLSSDVRKAAEPHAHAEPPLVGREEQLHTLEDAFEKSKAGNTVVVRVAGRSGSGKTALVQRFLDDIHDERDLLILSGRCYEQESVPFKAVDDLVDTLSRHLSRLSDVDVAAILPREVTPLIRVFPVLRRVRAIASAPSTPGAETLDSQELRMRAFGAFRELLTRLGDRRLLVVFVDDVQWGDLDSSQLLAHVLRSPDRPRMLLVVAYRLEDVETSAFLQAWQRGKATQGLEENEITVASLSQSEARQLAMLLLRNCPQAADQLEFLAHESEGNPFLLHEMAGYLRDEPRQKPRARLATLSAMLTARLQTLGLGAHALVETIAVAGQPVDESVAWQAAEVTPENRLVHDLRQGRLLRTVPLGERNGWDTYHDRVRETLLAQLTPAVLQRRHRQLAERLSQTDDIQADVLARHWRGAGDNQKAAELYAIAADHAAATLAFNNAAEFYRLAIQTANPNAEDRRELLTKLGHMLASAGRGKIAGDVFMQAAALIPDAAAFDLSCDAVYCYMISGHTRLGYQLAEKVLKQVGMAMPKSPVRAALSLFASRTWVRMTGLRFKRLRAADMPSDYLKKINACLSVGFGLGAIDPLRGALFLSKGLQHSLRTGDVNAIARALAFDAAQISAGGGKRFKTACNQLERAREIAGSTGEAKLIGTVHLMEGISVYLQGKWRDCIAPLTRANSLFSTESAESNWEITTAQIFEHWALAFLGDLKQLALSLPRLLSCASEQGNRYAVASHSFSRQLQLLASDMPDAAHCELAELGDLEGAPVQFSNKIYNETQLLLYEGNGAGAWRRLSACWATIRQSYVLHIELMRSYLMLMRGLCALSSAFMTRSKGELAEARRCARALSRESTHHSQGFHALLAAGIAGWKGCVDDNEKYLRVAVSRCAASEMALHLNAAKWRLGEIVGGSEGASLLADSGAWFSSHGVKSPVRLVRVLAPSLEP